MSIAYFEFCCELWQSVYNTDLAAEYIGILFDTCKQS